MWISGPARPGRLARLGGTGPESTQGPKFPFKISNSYLLQANYALKNLGGLAALHASPCSQLTRRFIEMGEAMRGCDAISDRRAGLPAPRLASPQFTSLVLGVLIQIRRYQYGRLQHHERACRGGGHGSHGGHVRCRHDGTRLSSSSSALGYHGPPEYGSRTNT